MKRNVGWIIDQLNAKLEYVPPGSPRSFTVRRNSQNDVIVRMYDPGVTRLQIVTTIISESGFAGYLRRVDVDLKWVEFVVFVRRY